MRAMTRMNSNSPAIGRRLARRTGAAAALVLALATGGAGLAVLGATPAGAQSGTTRYVSKTGSDTTGGTNTCANQATPCATIGHAITEAAPGDTISIGAGTFAESGLSVGKDLVIEGAGDTVTTIQGSGTLPVLSIPAAVTVTVSGLTLTGGGSANVGGGIDIPDAGANVTVSNVSLRNDTAPIGGGAIYEFDSTLTLNDTLMLDDSSQGSGGAIYAYDGSVTLHNSVVSSSQATANGGAIVAFGTLVQTVGSTLQDNVAEFGGAIFLASDTSNVAVSGNATTTTFFGNDASIGGGGAVFADGGAFGVYHDSFESNVAATGADAVEVGSGAVAFQASILDDSPGTGLAECVAAGGLLPANTLFDYGYNLSDDVSCNLNGVGSSGGVAPARLGLSTTPGPNGGFVGTLRLSSTSVAHDVVPANLCAGNDARGVPFLQGAATSCDAGAFQYAPPVITGISPSFGLPTGGTAVTLTGSGFTLVGAATVGGQVATVQPGGNDTSLVVATPAGPSGPATLSLYSNYGTGSTTFTYVAPSLTLSAVPASPVAGTVTLTETVSPGSEASGVVAFTDAGTPIPGCGAVAVANGRASCTTVLPAGTTTIGAAITEAGATYPAPTDDLVVGTATPTVSLASSASHVTTGSSVTLTADVAGQPIAPSGTVRFVDGGTTIASCAAVTLANGAAACSTVLASGTHSLTAAYSGSADYSGATSGAVAVAVGTPSPVVQPGSGKAHPLVRVRRVAGPRGGTESVLLACSRAACRGTVTISTVTRVAVVRGTQRETVVLARAAYVLGAGRSAVVRLRLDAVGSRLVAKRTSQRVVATLKVNVVGGTGATTPVRL